MLNITDAFTEKYIAASQKEPTQAQLKAVKRCLLDYLGVTVAGAKVSDDFSKGLLDGLKSDCGESTVIGCGVKTSLINAVFINAFNAHTIELDDGHRFGMVHLGAVIFPALIAVCENEHTDVNAFIRGAVAGYDAAISLACAVQPSHKLKGFHATGTCGCIGATVAIAVALKFTAPQMKSAISAAAAFASGLLEVIEGASQMKPLNVANAAKNAVMAAYVGKNKLIPPQDALGGKRGFISNLCGDVNVDNLVTVSEASLIETIYMKPYAACRHCHAPIEASLRLYGKLNINDIAHVEVETYRLAVRGHDHVTIEGMNSAKMSIPYSVAVALATGKAGMNEYTDSFISDLDICALTKKISVVEKDELTALCPAKRVAILHVQLTSGETLCETVEFPKGEPENPLSEGDIRDKFISLAMYGGKSNEQALQIIENVNELSSIEKILLLL